MYRHVFMYDGRDKNTNLQTNGSIKYILNVHFEKNILSIHEGVMHNKIYCN